LTQQSIQMFNSINQLKKSMAATIDQLFAFIAVAETGHFTRAAERLNLSQSSLSASIHRLESLLGVRLFDRHTRGCKLSEAGQALLDSARRMTQEWSRMASGATDFQHFGRGRLSVAAPTVQCALLLPPLLREFQAEHPGVRVEVHDVAEQEVQDLVRTGVVDLGVISQTDARNELIATPFHTDEYILVVPKEHQLAKYKQVGWQQLADQPIIGAVKGNPVRRRLDATLAEKGLSLGYTHEVSLPWTMIGLVREGFGVAVLTTAVLPLIRWNKLEARPLVRPTITRTLVLLRAHGRSPDPLVASFSRRLLHLQRQTPDAMVP
jgi:LysR family transcriptional regulator, carnitine catabolism transcriptional activator